jgi:pSer/pThr/pTyr-binding forkhead associated (FHA) protein
MAGEMLRVVAGRATGLELPVDTELLLGRGADGPGTLAGDPELSRGHARLIRTGGGDLLVEDLGSTNGTRVNGSAVTEHTLADGDTITVGDTTIRFEAH